MHGEFMAIDPASSGLSKQFAAGADSFGIELAVLILPPALEYYEYFGLVDGVDGLFFAEARSFAAGDTGVKGDAGFLPYTRERIRLGT